MDSKRRHELSQNSLANWINTHYEDWIRPNSQWIGLLFVAVVAIAAVATGYSRLTQWNKSSGWQQYFAAVYSSTAIADLEAIADSSDNEITRQSRLSLGQILLAEGCDRTLENAVQAKESLEKAVVQFEILTGRNIGEAELQRQAWFGLAQAREALAATRSGEGDLEKAVEAYESIAKRWPEDLLGKRAGKRAEELKNPATAKFFELAAAKAAKDAEKPAAEDFKVDIDPKSSFGGGPTEFDPQKALGGSSILGGAFSDAVPPKKEGADAVEDKPADTEKAAEEKADDKPAEKTPEPVKTEEKTEEPE